jgi:hypothetical protein
VHTKAVLEGDLVGDLTRETEGDRDKGLEGVLEKGRLERGPDGDLVRGSADLLEGPLLGRDGLEVLGLVDDGLAEAGLLEGAAEGRVGLYGILR